MALILELKYGMIVWLVRLTQFIVYMILECPYL